MANIFPLHDNGDPYTSEELAQARETMGRKLLTAAMDIDVYRAKARQAQRERDNLVRGYIEVYGGTIAEAARLAQLDRSAISKILHPKAGK